MDKEKKIQVKFLEMETTMTKMKNKMDGINSRFENGGKKYFQEFEDINNGNNPKWRHGNNPHGEKNDKNMNRAPVNCGTPLNGLTYV